jgi:hypothetical protein
MNPESKQYYAGVDLANPGSDGSHVALFERLGDSFRVIGTQAGRMASQLKKLARTINHTKAMRPLSRKQRIRQRRLQRRRFLSLHPQASQKQLAIYKDPARLVLRPK